MAAARFLLGSPSVGERAATSGHRPRTTSPDTARTWVTWRLVGGNNRGLGRGVHPYPDLEACRVAVEQLRRELADADLLTTYADGTSGAWGWRVGRGGQDLAVSSRTYQRQRESRYSLEQFLAAVPLALPFEAVVVQPRLRVVRRTDRVLASPAPGLLATTTRVLT